MDDQEKRIAALETSSELSKQLFGTIDKRIDGLHGKMDIICQKIDTFIQVNNKQETDIAVLKESTSTMKDTIKKVEDNQTWALRTGISGLIAGLSALAGLLWKFFHK